MEGQEGNRHQTASKISDLAVQKFGGIDGMVINHGVLTPMTRLVDASVEDWKQLYDVNVFSGLALVRPTPNGRCGFEN